MSHRARILVLVALVALPLLLLSIASAAYSYRQQEQSLNEERVAVARAVAAAVEGLLEGDLAAVQAIAAQSAVRDFATAPPEDVEHAMLRIFNVFPNLETLGLIGPDGWNVRSVTRHVAVPPRTVNVSDRPYFQQAFTTGDIVVSPAVLSRVRPDVPVVAIAVPIVAPDDGSDPEIRGVLVGTLSLGQLQEFMHATLSDPHVDIVLIDSSGQVMLASDIDPAAQRELVSLANRPDVDAALGGEAGSMIVRDGDDELLVGYAPVGVAGWGVLVEEETGDAFAPARAEAIRSVGLLALALAFSFSMALWLSSRLARSYDELDVARAASERGRERLAFLAASSRQLSATLDYESTLSTIASMAVPGFADWCVVDLVERGQMAARRMAIVHGDPAHGALTTSLQEADPIDHGSAVGVAHVMRTGEAVLVEDVSPEMLAAEATDERNLDLIRQAAPRSAIIAPLRGPAGVFGAMTFVTAESGHRYGQDDLDLALDLADRAALAVENARLFAEAQDAVRTRDEFLAAASHDLKNPLSAVKLRAQLLQRRATRPEPLPSAEVIEATAAIDDIVDRAVRLVDELMDVTRLQLGRPLDLELEATDLARILREVAAEVQASTTAHELRLVMPEEPIVGQWDARRLRRVAENLLDNAVKYSPDGGQVTVNLVREADASGERVVVSIRDTGVGIPADDVPRLFERFRRGSNVVGQFRGTGIGLASAHQIVTSHGGTIEVDSIEGGGTVVTVRLPVSEG
ncbi:MAG TPA: sensor histidine kinase [Thermomicrobiales bacterium]|nr:sensor histidine kinase [Thermomicrobiales bacterium]